MTRSGFCLTILAGGALALGLAGGCVPGVDTLDERERGDALMQRAHAKAVSGDIDGAIRTYMKLIDLEPGLARAHLDVALLFDDSRKEYVRAIYHYQRYLELRPKTEKRALIENRIRLASQHFAAGLFRPGRTPPPEDIAELKKENKALRDRIAELQRELDLAQASARARVAAAPGPVPDPSRGTEPTRSPAPDARTWARHVVQPGERLKAIANRYGVAMAAIVEANGLKDANTILVGQELVIPAPAGR